MADRLDGRHRAAFIDRDGTVIEERGDLSDPDMVFLLPGSAEALLRLSRAGLLVILVTNQSGIAREAFTLDEFRVVQQRMFDLLERAGARLDGVYFCPHHPDVDGPCQCRKPAAGLYRQAAVARSIDLARSFYVGDRWRDVAVTREVGGVPFLVRTGAGGKGAPPGTETVADLSEAAHRILAMLAGEATGRA
ncbi:MAG: HAD family hydrolase [Gemmatimonadota bacterium]|nr:MAG: HAD family hydrolase [Gemmatimonadota bacterium]